MEPQKANKAKRPGKDRKQRSEPGRSRSVILADIAKNGCRFPDGKSKEGRHTFCNEPVAQGKSFCPEHCQRVFKKREDLE